MMKKNIAVQWWVVGLLLCGSVAISACAIAQPPVASLSRAELAVDRANESNASQYAPMELQLARDKLDEAQLALKAGDYERAHRLAEQALADARLAEARAEIESSRQTARDLRLTIETLREEAARASAASVYIPQTAPIELRLAREKLDEARLALDVRAYERAHRLAENGLADARLAELRAVTERARLAARELRLSLETVRAEAARLAALY